MVNDSKIPEGLLPEKRILRKNYAFRKTTGYFLSNDKKLRTTTHIVLYNNYLL
jgi:hypothetical protein